MKYTKQPLSIQQQIEKFKSRGLIIKNENAAANYLSNISYYRLRAYTYPFQNNVEEDKDHCFIRSDIHFNDIIDLYCFDRRLRALIFNAIEKIEIAVRAKIVQRYAESTMDSHWFTDESLFNNSPYFVTNDAGIQEEIFPHDKLLEDIKFEIIRNYSEDFIKHYKEKYRIPELPPSWMVLEVSSFGILSRLYKLLRKTGDKKEIARWFGLTEISIMENWLHSISVLRNCCAHHSRVWNRRFPVGIKMPYNTINPFIDRETMKTIHNNKVFASLSCIKYILDIISPNAAFKKNLIDIINNGGKLLKIKDMGFPENWKYLDVWKEK